MAGRAEVRLLTNILGKFKHLHGALLLQLCRMLIIMKNGCEVWPLPRRRSVQGRSRLSEPLTFLYAAWSAKTPREACGALLEAVSVDRFTNDTTATS